MAKYLDDTGLRHLWDKIKDLIINSFKFNYSPHGKNYPVSKDESDNLYVNVPWVNTTYEKATQDKDGLLSKEDKKKIDENILNHIQPITMAEYNAILEKDPNRIYYIRG